MTFGAGTGIWGEIAGLDRAQATRLVATAVERGVNLIDTADAYSQGQSEQVVGQVLAHLGLDETRMLVPTSVGATCPRKPMPHKQIIVNPVVTQSTRRPASNPAKVIG